MVRYEDLSPAQKRGAQAIAKELLNSTPPATVALDAASPRGALSSAFAKPERLEAVVIYCDGYGSFWGDVVFRKRQDVYLQLGTPSNDPDHSIEDALKRVRTIIASSKLNWEAPLVRRLRERGLDPDYLTLFGIETKKSGLCYVALDDEVREASARRFLERHSWDVPPEALIETAVAMLVDHVDRHVGDQAIVKINEFPIEESAAQFIAMHGIDSVCEPLLKPLKRA